MKLSSKNGNNGDFRCARKRFGGTVEIDKEGNKIHIKPSRKGSFTRWCGGKVTEECIRRGKASKDPRIRKKSIFAENSRKWSK